MPGIGDYFPLENLYLAFSAGTLASTWKFDPKLMKDIYEGSAPHCFDLLAQGIKPDANCSQDLGYQFLQVFHCYPWIGRVKISTNFASEIVVQRGSAHQYFGSGMGLFDFIDNAFHVGHGSCKQC